MTLDAIEFIRRFLLHVLPSGFVKIRHFGLLANRNRRQALALCRLHLRATTPDISTLLTEPQKSALNRSCPQCKRGTLHVVARQLSDGTGQLPRTVRLRTLRLILRKTCPCIPTRSLASTAFIPPTLPHGLESAPHDLDACAALPCAPQVHP